MSEYLIYIVILIFNSDNCIHIANRSRERRVSKRIDIVKIREPSSEKLLKNYVHDIFKEI